LLPPAAGTEADELLPAVAITPLVEAETLLPLEAGAGVGEAAFDEDWQALSARAPDRAIAAYESVIFMDMLIALPQGKVWDSNRRRPGGDPHPAAHPVPAATDRRRCGTLERFQVP
jgi:hypothetical protein